MTSPRCDIRGNNTPFNMAMMKGKHVLEGPLLTLCELDTITGLVPTTVAVDFKTELFAVAFDSPGDLHTASLMLAAIRQHHWRMSTQRGR